MAHLWYADVIPTTKRTEWLWLIKYIETRFVYSFYLFSSHVPAGISSGNRAIFCSRTVAKMLIFLANTRNTHWDRPALLQTREHDDWHILLFQSLNNRRNHQLRTYAWRSVFLALGSTIRQLAIYPPIQTFSLSRSCTTFSSQTMLWGYQIYYSCIDISTQQLHRRRPVLFSSIRRYPTASQITCWDPRSRRHFSNIHDRIFQCTHDNFANYESKFSSIASLTFIRLHVDMLLSRTFQPLVC